MLYMLYRGKWWLYSINDILGENYVYSDMAAKPDL